jgi:hypothetical protein
MGGTGISKSEASRICSQLDGEVAIWREQPLGHTPFPYVFLDATYCKVGINGRVVSQAVVVATGVSAGGSREVLGCAVGDGETETFWTEFLRGLKDRGLGGVQLVISDSHAGLIKAVAATMQGASWQRCRVHCMRNALARVSKGEAEMVAAAIRTIFAQPGQGEVRAQVEAVADMLTGRFPAVAALLLAAKAGLTAFADFPRPHWQKIWSTNPIERLNREVKRRTDVVGIFPNPDAQPAPCPDRSARRMARARPPLPLRGVDGPAHPTTGDPDHHRTHRSRHTRPYQDHRRYGIVNEVRRATRDELHHAKGRDPGRHHRRASTRVRNRDDGAWLRSRAGPGDRAA